MDARALAPLLTEERPRFVRLAQRRLPTRDDAEDVVQRAMTRAVEQAASLQDAARVGPWFHRILLRSVADFYRSRRPETPSGEIEIASEDAEPTRVSCPCALRLLGELRPPYADVLRRVDVDGGTIDEVAAALAISSGTLHVRLHRARRALRERLGAHCGVETCGPCLDCSCDTEHRCGDASGGYSASTR